MEILVRSIGGRDSLAEHVGEWNTIVNDEYLGYTLKHVKSVWWGIYCGLLPEWAG